MFPFTAPPVPHQPTTSADSMMLLERAPGLREGAELLLASVVKSLQTMAGDSTSIEGMVAGIAATSTRDLVGAHRAEAIAATIECSGLPCTILVTLDPILIHAIVELLAGGNGSEPPPAVSRVPTAIDQQYAHIVVALAASAIEAEWSTNGFGSARALRLDGGITADVIGARVLKAGIVTLALEVFGLRGTLALALPPTALDAFRHGDVAAPGNAAPQDPAWKDLLERQVGRAPVKVEAYLQAQDISLGAIAGLRPGQVISLVPQARSLATIVCDGQSLYRGELGQHEDRFSLRIDEVTATLREAPTRVPRDKTLRSSDLAKAS